jgi:hypothetical protein
VIVWPWTARVRASNLLAAVHEWAGEHGPKCVAWADYLTAKGYFLARDWLGVEAVYARCRERIEPSTPGIDPGERSLRGGQS